MTTSTKTRRPGADWRILAAACRSTPGEWRQLPPEYPLLNRARVKDGNYKHLEPAGAYEVRGRAHGEQSARFIGDPIDYAPMWTDGVPLRDLVRRVSMPDWYELRREWVTGPGFTTLPMNDRPRGTSDDFPLVREVAP